MAGTELLKDLRCSAKGACQKVEVQRAWACEMRINATPDESDSRENPHSDAHFVDRSRF